MEEFATSPHINRTRAIERPLLGLTILLVEDSRYFSDAVRLMAIRSGARLRRADCIHSARKHTKIYRPDAVIIDLGLPDGAGQDLIDEMMKIPNAPPIIGISGGDVTTSEKQALDAGAIKFVQKPFFDLASFQQTILSVMPETSQANGFKPRIAGDQVQPDAESLVEDYNYVSQILKDAIDAGNADKLDYSAQFLSSVAKVTGDDELIAQSVLLNTRLNTGQDCTTVCGHIQELLATRIAA